MHNTFGQALRLEISGASHSERISIRMEGVPAGIPLCTDDFRADLDARRAGAMGTTPRRESDTPEIEGTVDGQTDGSAITISFRNENTRSGDYSQFRRHPRPSHVDFVADRKYGEAIDLRGSGQFSGRMTVALVAAGVVAKKMLPDVAFTTRIAALGGQTDPATFDAAIDDAIRNEDSIGGVIECRAAGITAGWGEPFFDSVESTIAHLLFSVPAVKGVEFGDGFAAAALRGSQHNDPIIDAEGHTATNHAGGVDGGIANGNELIVRAAVKPTASIAREQQTFDFAAGKIAPLGIRGGHDA